MGAGQSTADKKAAEAAKKAAEAAEKAAKEAVKAKIADLDNKIRDFKTGPFSNMLNCILREDQKQILIANLEAEKAKLQEDLEQYKSDL